MAFERQSTVPFIVSLALAATLVWRVAPYLELNNVQPGDRAPGFELTADSGVGVSLDDYRGKYVLLNFWATWCPPCVQELPSLNTLHQQLERDGLVVLGVSVDAQQEQYNSFLESFGVAFPTARDPEMKIASLYGTSKYPETYLIDPEGYVLRKYVGAENWTRPEIVNYLRSLL